MAVTFTLFPNFKLKQHNGVRVIDLDSASIKVAILTNSYTPADANDVWSDISANEVAGSGYSAGGTAISGVTLTGAPNPVWAFSDITWAQNASGFSNGRRFVAYDVTTGGLIAYSSAESADFGNAAGDLTLDVGVSGVGSFTG